MNLLLSHTMNIIWLRLSELGRIFCFGFCSPDLKFLRFLSFFAYKMVEMCTVQQYLHFFYVLVFATYYVICILMMKISGDDDIRG